MSTVTISQVRSALNEVDQSLIPDSTINMAIDFAVLDIQTDPGDLDIDDQQVYDMAVIMTSAYNAFMSSPPQTRRSAINVSGQWDMEEYVDFLEDRMERAKEELGETDDGMSSAFFKHTEGILRD